MFVQSTEKSENLQYPQNMFAKYNLNHYEFDPDPGNFKGYLSNYHYIYKLYWCCCTLVEAFALQVLLFIKNLVNFHFNLVNENLTEPLKMSA